MLNFLLARSLTKLLTAQSYEADLVCTLSGSAQGTPWSGQVKPLQKVVLPP